MTEIHTTINPVSMIRPRRKITGISAILLPFRGGQIDWQGFEAHIVRTLDAGLIPAVNMDTGYVNLLDDVQRAAVLDRTQDAAAGCSFVAGAFVADRPGAGFNPGAYQIEIEAIQSRGGTPVIFQSYGLVSQPVEGIVRSYEAIAEACDSFIGFELGEMFAPFGRIYDLETYRELMSIPRCIGVKHSSLDRGQEWQRIALRDQVRPEFKVFTGNDLAIDMVIYGSDYLLGLSTFAPDLFARRDALWEAGDPGFYTLNDVLQYLGFFAFRSPVPAYKHSAAQFLRLRGWLATDEAHPSAPHRPESDLEVLREIAARLGVLDAEGAV